MPARITPINSHFNQPDLFFPAIGYIRALRTLSRNWNERNAFALRVARARFRRAAGRPEGILRRLESIAHGLLPFLFHLLEFRSLGRIEHLDNPFVRAANDLFDLFDRPRTNGIHLLPAFLENRLDFPNLLRPQVELGLQTMPDAVANRLAVRRVPPSLFGAGPAQHSAGHAADEENRGQIHDDFVFGQMTHGNMLIRIAESAMATEPGSRSFNA